MSIATPIRTPPRVADASAARGLLDTSVIIELERVAADELPAQIAIAAVTLAELAAGPHATSDPVERARRQDRLQRAEAMFQAIPFDTDAARAYGHVYTRVASSGRKARGKRAPDLLIAATALAADLPLHTRNPADFDGLGDVLDIVAVSATKPST